MVARIPAELDEMVENLRLEAAAFTASNANTNAPTMFVAKTIVHSRAIPANVRRSRRSTATTTGYSVFSVKSCARPTITAMKPIG